MRVVLFLLFLSVLLVSSTETEPPLNAKDLRKKAEAAQLNGKFVEAVDLYTKLIALEPTAANYVKRASINMRRPKFSAALKDYEFAQQTDSSFAVKVLPHIARCKMALGDCAGAVVDYQAVLNLTPDDKKSVSQLPQAKECVDHIKAATSASLRGDKHTAQMLLTKAIAIAPYSVNLLLKRSEIYVSLGQFQDALVDTRSILLEDKANLDALALRGQAFFGLAEHDNALNQYKEGLKSDPDHKKLKGLYKDLQKYTRVLKTGEDHIQRGNFAGGVESFRELLQLDPSRRGFNAQLQSRICDALTKLKKGKEAVQACSAAIAVEENNIQFRLLRAEAHMSADMFQEAINDFQKASEIDPNNHAARQGRERAHLELKKSKRKDYYKILGLEKNANEKEIKRAFRKLALQFHPDRHQGEEDKAEAEVKFREIGEAHDILSDPEKRGRYDRGEDVDQPQQQHHQNPFGGQGFHFGGGQQFHFNHGGGQQFHFRG